MFSGTTKEVIEFILTHDKEAKQYRLAKELKCSKQLVYLWRKGKQNISDKFYRRLKKIYPMIEITDASESYTLGNIEFPEKMG